MLGCVIKGETDHYDIVKNISMNEIYSLVYKKVIPLGSAILTVNNFKQAIERSDIKKKFWRKSCYGLLQSYQNPKIIVI